MGWYDDRAHLAGRTDSQWTPDWDAQSLEIFPPVGSPEPEVYDPNPPPTFQDVGDPAVQPGYVFPPGLPCGEGVDCQACYGALVTDPYGSSNQIVAAPDPNDTDGTWEVDGITGPLTGSSSTENPVGSPSYQAPQSIPESLVAAPSGNQPDDLSISHAVAPGGDQGVGQLMSLRELARPAPGTEITTPVYKTR